MFPNPSYLSISPSLFWASLMSLEMLVFPGLCRKGGPDVIGDVVDKQDRPGDGPQDSNQPQKGLASGHATGLMYGATCRCF